VSAPKKTPSTPATGHLAELLACPPHLLDLTLDQLRTLLVVRESGAALPAARVLGREQSSVAKQLDTLNRIFRLVAGEALVIKQGRGQDMLFTPTGDAVAELADASLAGWLDGVQDWRRRLGRTLAVGTTEFTLDFLGRIWPRVELQFAALEVELKVRHVRTKDFWAALDSTSVDLILGGLATSVGTLDVPDRYEFAEWHREGLVLLTNLTVRELPLAVVDRDRFARIPLLVPSAGVITDFLARWFGPEWHERLDIVATIDDVYYGLALLRSGLARGCMIASRSIAEGATDGRLPGRRDFRLIELADDFKPRLELVSGAFARAGDRQKYKAAHPINLLWDALRQEASVPGRTDWGWM
jgi:DNA-binding transcriptional LysR family regulator